MRGVRMITELQATEKEVPKTIPIPFVDIEKNLTSYGECGCLKFDCDCYGQPNCTCCYPECACAPSMISPTETEIIITTKKVEVPQDYIYTITREVP